MSEIPFGWVGHGGTAGPGDEWVGFVLFDAAPDEKTRQRIMALAPRLLRKKPSWQGPLLRMRKRGFTHLIGEAYGRGAPAELTPELQAELDAFPPGMRAWIERQRAAAGGTVNWAAFSRELYEWLARAHELSPILLVLVATEHHERELLTEVHRESLTRMVECAPRLADLLAVPDPRVAHDFCAHVFRYAAEGAGTLELDEATARALWPLISPPLGVDDDFRGMRRVLEHLSDADYAAAIERLSASVPALIAEVKRQGDASS